MTRIWSLLLGLLFVVLQVTLANLLTLFGVKPDFIILFVVARALREGATAGVLWGFGLGLLLDAVSGGLMGLGSLAYSIGGFISGKMGGRKLSGRWPYLISLLLSALATQGILLYFSTPWEETGMLAPILRQFLPSVLYTWGMGLLWMLSPFFYQPLERKRA